MCTILIADTNKKFNLSLKSFLTEEGYHINIADDGLSAFNSAILDHPDLIISSIKLPRLDGYELLMALQLNSDTATIPVILTSEDNEIRKANLGITLGAKDFFIKPFEMKDLLKSIKMARKGIEYLKMKEDR